MKKSTLIKLVLSVLVSMFLMIQSNSSFAQCTNTSSYGSATAPTSGTVTISTCSYQTEYSTLNSVVAGTTYSCANSNGGYVTIRSGSYNGTVVAHGNSSLTWTATTSGTHYCHWNTNSSCGTATGCGTTTCTFISSGPDCGTNYIGSISPSSCSPQNANYSSGTIPYWSFSATSGYTYHFSLTSNTEDSYLRLYNSSYTQIAYNDDNGPFGSGYPASLSWTCTSSGTYYISAAHYSCVTFTNSSYLKYWSTDAAYGSGSGNTITPTASWQNQAYTSGSLYWYNFSATSGTTYDFSLCANTEDSYIRIFDTNWGIITSYDDNGPHCSGTPSSGSWVATSTATFIVSIYNYGCDPFENSGNLAYRHVVPCTTPANPTASGTATICNGQSTNISATSTNATSIYWYTGSCGGTQVGTSSPGANFSVSPTTTTTYYARGNNSAGDGCWSSGCGSVTITVNIPPTAPTGINGTTTICNGSSTLLTASGGIVGSGCIYQWYAGGCGSGSSLGVSNSLSVSPTTTTTYYVRRVGSSPCDGTITSCASVTVTVNQPPTDPTGISGTTSICIGSSTLLTATGGSEGDGCTYQWYAGGCGSGGSLGSSSSLSVSPASATTYYVRRVGNTICSNTTGCASVTITVIALPAISGQPSNSSITYGDASSFTVTASDGTSYQWQEYISSWNDISDGGVYSNATTATLNLTKPPVSMDGYQYRCVVSGDCTPAATSDGNATLSVTAKGLSVTADADQFKYETQSDPVFTYIATGFATGEDVGVLTGVLSRDAGEDVGLYDINIGSLAGVNYSINFTSADFEIKPAYLMNLTVFLQGSYNSVAGEMNTTLNPSQLPTGQPFNVDPWFYAGTESVGTMPADVVDWVLVELRSDASTTLEKKAGLLYKDGSVKVSFTGSSAGGDYVVVWHRNHMPVMSNAKVSLPISGASFNLTSSSNLYGTNPAIDLGSGIYGMITGDVTKNGVLQYSGPGNDRGAIIQKIVAEGGTTINSVVTGGYWFEDVNLNNELRYIGTDDDRSSIYSNLGILTGVYQTNAIYTSVVPGASKGKDTGTNDGPFDIQLTESNQAIALEMSTTEAVVNGLVDNIQFTLAWKAADIEIADLLNSFTSDFILAPQGEVYEMDGVMRQVYVSVTPINLPELFNEGDIISVMSIPNPSGLTVTGRLWIADDEFTTDNNAMYYVSVWGNDFTGMIQSVATGLNDILAMESVKIYPNPVINGSVNIALNLTIEQKVTIFITDMQGKLISTKDIYVNAGLSIYPYDVNGLDLGVYFIRITGDKLNTVEKLIVK